MRPDDEGAQRDHGARRYAHRGEPGHWAPAKSKTPPPAWNDKTMHHPATRIGEIEHGKS